MARDYSQYWAELKTSHSSHPANRFRYRLIARELASRKLEPRRVVDCGCGDGSLLAVVARHLPHAELHGIDLAGNVPAASAGGAIRFCQQDLGSPVPASLHARFDLVLCSEVIEHVARDDILLRNLYDLAASGGWVMLSTQSGPIYRTEQFLGHLRHYSCADLCRRLEEAGLRVRKAYVCGWPWLNLQKLAAHVFHRAVQTHIVQADRLAMPVRALFFLLSHLYRWSSRRRGPQIIVLAQK